MLWREPSSGPEESFCSWCLVSEMQGLEGTWLQGRPHLVGHTGSGFVYSAWKPPRALGHILVAMLRMDRRARSGSREAVRGGCDRRALAQERSQPVPPLDRHASSMVRLQREKGCQ